MRLIEHLTEIVLLLVVSVLLAAGLAWIILRIEETLRHVG